MTPGRAEERREAPPSPLHRQFSSGAAAPSGSSSNVDLVAGTFHHVHEFPDGEEEEVEVLKRHDRNAVIRSTSRP